MFKSNEQLPASTGSRPLGIALTTPTILDRLPLVKQQHDGSWLAHCPAHEDSRPSLVVSRGENDKLLLNCRANCEITKIVAALGCEMSDLFDVTFPQSFGDIAVLPVTPLSDSSLILLESKAKKFAGQFDSLDFVRESFGLDAETAKRLMLGTNNDGTRVSVPFRNLDGDVIGMQQRAVDDSEPRWTTEPNPSSGGTFSRIGYFQGDHPDYILITEGPSDALAAVAAGYSAIAIRGAGMVNEDIVSSIVTWAGTRKIILCGDGDTAGGSFNDALTTSIRLRNCQVFSVTLNDGSDLRSILIADGVDALIAVIEDHHSAIVIPARDGSRFPRNDVANAQLAVELGSISGDKLRHAPGIGWLTYLDGAWQADILGVHRIVARQVGQSTLRLADNLTVDLAEASKELSAAKIQVKVAADSSDEEDDVDALKTEVSKLKLKVSRLASLEAQWQRWAQYCNSSSGLSNLLKEFMVEPSISTRIEDLDSHNDLLLVANGVVNLRTKELTPFDPDLLMTQRIPVAYRPDAKSERWDTFLGEVMEGADGMPEYLQRLVGYGITGLTQEQCFVIHYGLGSNGKSIFIDTLSHVFSGIYRKTPMKTFLKNDNSSSIPADVAALRGSRLVFASEADANARLSEALLKEMTGDASITARLLHQNFFTFTPQFLIQMATNHKPVFTSQGNGIWRRVRLIKWGRTFTAEQQDHNLLATLRTEEEGILRWAVDGAAIWYANGLQDPDSVKKAVTDYKEMEDTLYGFLPGVYELCEPEGKPLKGSAVFKEFSNWAFSEEIQFSFRRRAFFNMLEERGVTRIQDKSNGVLLSGMRLTNPKTKPTLDDPNGSKPDFLDAFNRSN